MKLYIGNLPWSVTDQSLQELFSTYGQIEEAIIIKDKFSKRSKGFGFVTFSNDEDAKKAISEMNEKEVEGRSLTVSEARPMIPRDNARRDSTEENSEAPIANPSQINSSIEETVSSEAESNDSEDEIETVEEAKEDAEEDEPATKNATSAEETSE